MTALAWFNREFWGPVWPNLAASPVCAAVAVVRIRIHLARHQNAMAREHAATRDLVSGLHERLDALGAEQKEMP